MNDEVVPKETKLAAKRGFVRTTAQAYAATIPAGGISAAILSNVIDDPNPVQIIATVGAWVLSPLLAGAASYLSIVSNGVPEEYVAAAQ